MGRSLLDILKSWFDEDSWTDEIEKIFHKLEPIFECTGERCIDVSAFCICILDIIPEVTKSLKVNLNAM